MRNLIAKFVDNNLTEEELKFTVDTIEGVLLSLKETYMHVVLERVFSDEPDSLKVIGKRHGFTAQGAFYIQRRFIRKLKEEGVELSSE